MKEETKEKFDSLEIGQAYEVAFEHGDFIQFHFRSTLKVKRINENGIVEFIFDDNKVIGPLDSFTMRRI